MRYGYLGFVVRCLTNAIIGLAAATVLGGCLPSKPPTPQRFATSVNSVGMTFVRLPGGEFLMGGDYAKPVHRARLSGFWIGQYEVTNAQFEQFRKRLRPPESLADNQPVTRVSWDDAVAFCRWMSKKEDKKYRLPTEAELGIRRAGRTGPETVPVGR